MKLSIVINADTRTPNTQARSMFDGVRNAEILELGIQNKLNAFRWFDHEVIVFIDEHEPLPADTLSRIREMADTVVIRKHGKRYRGMRTSPSSMT